MQNDAHQLHRFAEAFKSEDVLRKHLATLLNKMPHTQGVQITHGTHEYGKDIVFYAPDGFENWQLNACVVKNGKITGSADDDIGARTVFAQAEQALDTPFINNAGEEERVSKVFIISPHDCSQSTMHSIEGKLKANFGKVEFLCGALLLEKFSKFWPEFVIFESTLLGAYVAALQQNFDQSDPMTFLASQHYIFASANKTLRNVYVRQGFKISLQGFDLLVSAPNLQALLGPVTLNEVEQVREELAFVASLVGHEQVWENPHPRAAKELATSIGRLSNELKEKWLNEWERYEADYLAQGKRPPQPKGVTELRLTDVGGILESPPVRTMSEVLRAFEARVRKANDLVKIGRQREIALNSEEYLSYCRVREVTQLHPAAFRKQSSSYDKHYHETLLDELDAPVLVTAPAGSGKTSFCRWNTLNDVQRLTDRTSKVIPVYVPLHQLATANVTTCEEAFLRTPEVTELFSNAQKIQQRVRLYLDGLDEVTTTDQQGKLMRLAQEMASRYPHVQVAVTGRDYVSGPWLRWLSRVHLSELNTG